MEHTDKEIKDWVCSHIQTLVDENMRQGENEFSVAIEIDDKEGKSHPYTIFLELPDVNGEDEWVIRHIVRPEQLQ